MLSKTFENGQQVGKKIDKKAFQYLALDQLSYLIE